MLKGNVTVLVKEKQHLNNLDCYTFDIVNLNRNSKQYC